MLSSRSSPPSMRKLVALALSCAVCLLLYYSWSLGPGGRIHLYQHQSELVLPPTTIPKKLWFKLGPKGLSDEAAGWTDTFIQKNPEYRAEFLTDIVADRWVQENYVSRPDLVESYLDLSVPILKADLLRYLLLFMEGGVYSDLDVSCEIPIDDWIPAQYKSNTSLLVGWEFDVGWGENVLHQLNSWTMAAKPGLPHIMMAIEDILHNLHDVASKNNVAISNVTLPMVGDVVDFTGPRRLTRSVYKSLKQTLNVTDAEFESLEKSTFFIKEPVLLGDVLVLPGFSFAYSMNTYDEDVIVGPPLVKHHYSGSWKNNLGGEEV